MSSMSISRSKIFLILIISFIGGVFLANFYSLNFKFYLFISLFLLLVFGLIIRNKSFLLIIGAALIIFFGFLYFDWYIEKINPGQLPYDEVVTFEGIIDAYPDEREDKTKYTLKITNSDCEQLIGKRVLVDLSKQPKYNYSDLLKISGKIERPMDFDEFDYEMYLARYRIFALVKYNKFDPSAVGVQKISSGTGNKVFKLIYMLRTKIFSNFKKLFTEPHAGILSAIVLGLKRAIPSDFMERLRIIGLSHIMVISGFHVAVMIKIFQSITTSWSKKLVFLIGSLFLISFVVLTGGAPSVVRASIMAWLFLLAPILGRKGRITNILALTVFLMILENPLILVYDVSFQLSVLAVLGLIYLMPIFDKLVKRFGEIVGSAISATLSAQIMTLPLILVSFGRISVVAPLTNVIVTPFLPLIIPYGIIIAILSFISLKFTFVLSWPLTLLLKYIVIITDFFSSIRFSSIEISVGQWIIPLYFLILIPLLWIYYKRHKTNNNIT